MAARKPTTVKIKDLQAVLKDAYDRNSDCEDTAEEIERVCLSLGVESPLPSEMIGPGEIIYDSSGNALLVIHPDAAAEADEHRDDNFSSKDILFAVPVNAILGIEPAEMQDLSYSADDDGEIRIKSEK